MAKQSYTVELETRQHEFLQEMVSKFGLLDVGKAVRCLTDYAAAESDQQSRIFQEIRCNDC